MASLFKRGTWYYLSFFDSSRKPKRKQVALKTKTRRTALRYQVELEHAYTTRVLWNAQEVGLEENCGLLREAVEVFITSRSSLSSYTIKKYQSVLGLLVDYLGNQMPVADIKTEHLKDFLDSTKKKAVTQRTFRNLNLCGCLLSRKT